MQKFWGDILGLQKVKSFKSEKENVDEDVLTVGKGILGKIEVDIMTPLDPEKAPKVHIPPLNHIGLWVDDLPKCVEYLESKQPPLSITIYRKWRKNSRWHQEGCIRFRCDIHSSQECMWSTIGISASTTGSHRCIQSREMNAPHIIFYYATLFKL